MSTAPTSDDAPDVSTLELQKLQPELQKLQSELQPEKEEMVSESTISDSKIYVLPPLPVRHTKTSTAVPVLTSANSTSALDTGLIPVNILPREASPSRDPQKSEPLPRHTQSREGNAETFVWNPVRGLYELRGKIRPNHSNHDDRDSERDSDRRTIFDIWNIPTTSTGGESRPREPRAASREPRAASREPHAASREPCAAPREPYVLPPRLPLSYGYNANLVQYRYNRIDSRTSRDRSFRPRCYREQFHLERAWRHLGQTQLHQEIRIPQTLLRNNPNRAETGPSDADADADPSDSDSDSDGSLVIYQLRNGAFITPVTEEGTPAFWWGTGDNEDYAKPISAIEIYRPKNWPQTHFSLKLIFSARTWLVACPVIPDAQTGQDGLLPCGLEILTTGGDRIYLGCT